jgi:hypothetical protein
VKNKLPKDQYKVLMHLSQETAQADIKSMSRKQIADLSDYIFAQKGEKSDFSWAFVITPEINDSERQFIAWYVLKFTDYKPK